MSKGISDERKVELLRMRYVEGLSARAIARKLGMARRTVRDLLGRERTQMLRRPPAPRESILAPFEREIRARLESDRDLRAPPCSSTCGCSVTEAASPCCASACGSSVRGLSS